MTKILEMKYPRQVIQQKRHEIQQQLMLQSAAIKSEAITSISTADLYSLLELYDSRFFENWFRDSFRGTLHFSLSKRMTKSAGVTRCQKQPNKPISLPVFEIRIGIDFFFNYHLVEGSKKVCGINTNSSLEALQLVFEHELCHVLEFVHFNDSSCSKERFKTIAGNLFGHTESHHQLPTHKGIAYQKLGLKVGDAVSFMYEESELRGAIYNINKRATVMVKSKNGPYADQKGRRYSKYYVPLPLLKRIE